MFKSKTRSIIFPQAEHARLSGMIALAWGNEHFDKPAVPNNSFIAGVTFHDRGYGRLDTHPLGDMPSETWLDIHRRAAEERYNDPAAELVIQLQLLRLVGYKSTAERTQYVQERESFITSFAEEHSLDLSAFERADCITHFCDNISFDFCFEQPTAGGVSVYARLDDSLKTELRYAIHDNNRMSIDPWPLRESRYSFLIIGYEATNYPDELQPIAVEAVLEPGGAD